MSSGGDGDSGTEPVDNTVTTTATLPGYAQPYAEDLLYESYDLSNAEYNPYPEVPIAPLTPEHEIGLDAITNMSIYGSDEMNAAGQNYIDTMEGDYLYAESNPYLDSYIDSTLQQITDDFMLGTAAQTDKTFSMGNAFGSSAYDETVANNNELLAESLSQSATDIAYQNYADERANQVAFAPFGETAEASDWNNALGLLSVGDVYRDYDQAVMDYDLEAWNEAQAWPYTSLDVLASGLASSVGNAGTAVSETVYDG